MSAPSRETAFTELYRRYVASVRSYVTVCVPHDEVDDLVADTFLVAWRRFDDIPPDWPRGWLIGVARNVVRGRHRSSQRSTNLLAQLVALRPPTAATLGDGFSTEDLEVVTRAFSALKDTDQELLLLAGPYGLSTAELALAFGVSTNAIGVRLHRARRRLRRTYDDETTGGPR